MATIFISYTTADEEFVRKLASRLEEVGHTPIFSGGSLTAGQPWQVSLSQELREADCVVIVLSKASNESRWVMTEIGAALGYYQQRGRPLIIPLVIDDIDLPIPLAHIHALFAGDRDLDKIVVQITRAMASMAGRLQARRDEASEDHARVEANAAEYIRESLAELREKERSYRRIAYSWYWAALTALLSGVGFGLYRAFLSARTEATWQSIVHLAVASVLVIGLLGALSRFAFVLGKSFMVESLRNADRIHAISFGQFYLQAFGEKAEWSEIKDAFQHWNIDSGSSFITQSATDIDPQILQTAIEMARTMAGKSKDKG